MTNTIKDRCSPNELGRAIQLDELINNLNENIKNGDYHEAIVKAQLLQTAAKCWINYGNLRKGTEYLRVAVRLIRQNEMYGRIGSYSDPEIKQFEKLGRLGLASYLERKARRIERISLEKTK